MDKKTLFSKLPDAIKAKAKEVAEAVKVLMAENVEAATALAEGALADGTPIKYTGEKLDVGSEVFVVGEGGEVPAPEGEHALPDGTIMVIIKEGEKSVVSEIKQPEQEMSKEVKDMPSERITKIVEKFMQDKYGAKFSEQSKAIETLKIENDNLKLKVSRQAKLLADSTELIVAMGDIESEEPIEKPANKEAGSKHDKLKSIIKNSETIQFKK